MARILFLDLDDHGALQNSLESLGHEVIRGERTVLCAVDFVFCNADYADFGLIVKSVKSLHPPVPVIAVTLVSNSGKCLDALEAGASNYCNSLSDATQLRFILDGLGGGKFPPRPRLHRCHAA